jgi:hypothetical protein
VNKLKDFQVRDARGQDGPYGAIAVAARFDAVLRSCFTRTPEIQEVL